MITVDGLKFKADFESNAEVQGFGRNSLMLYALQLKFNIDDITTTATDSLIENDDKKADMIYIDTDREIAVIAQAYISEKIREAAKANKACDLNTAVSWLISRPISELPESLRSHASELRDVIKENKIKSVYFWYVHNLDESQNVDEELKTVEKTADALIKRHFESSSISIQAEEVGVRTIEKWYQGISTPILVDDDFEVVISGGYEIKGPDWKAFATFLPATWLYDQYNKSLLSGCKLNNVNWL